MNLFSGAIPSLENALNYASLKQKVISDNIANVDTPNYKAKDVSFKDMLDQELSISAKKTDERHMDFSGSNENPAVITEANVQYNNNGNSVDIDKQMSDMAANQIYYNALVSRISGNFQLLQSVIKGGS